MLVAKSRYAPGAILPNSNLPAASTSPDRTTEESAAFNKTIVAASAASLFSIRTLPCIAESFVCAKEKKHTPTKNAENKPPNKTFINK